MCFFRFSFHEYIRSIRRRGILKSDIPASVTIVFRVSGNGAQLFSVTAQHLWVECIFSSAAIAECLHDRIDFLLKHFGQLKTETKSIS